MKKYLFVFNPGTECEYAEEISFSNKASLDSYILFLTIRGFSFDYIGSRKYHKDNPAYLPTNKNSITNALKS
ncbi:hypothetical protein [Dysgonomonas sp. GY617]|uniref:hypothetical protein n=1 Tax=Dysgonomonas sp. GY617 TaxID=2780420 RepID=UPI0018836AD5|nr:hypothetical protein [Dysgonomonas sp. GY617]MBF0574409.1 hypothetical protein [Dysgonomonas sp. GY617]